MTASTTANSTVLELEGFLPYRLSVLSNTVSQAIAAEYEQRFGLSVTEWRVMAVLGRYTGISAREVAERTAMDKVAVSRAVARLLESGRIGGLSRSRSTSGERNLLFRYFCEGRDALQQPEAGQPILIFVKSLEERQNQNGFLPSQE